MITDDENKKLEDKDDIDLDDDLDLDADFDDDDLDLDLDLDDETDFDDDGGGGNKLAELWNTNPLVKVGAIAGAVILVVIILFSFGGDDNQDAGRSRVASGSDISATPGTEVASPAYIEAVEEANEASIEEAFATGGSAIPVPISTPVGRVDLNPEDDTNEEDPLARWRRLQEERLQREIEQQNNQEQVFQQEVFIPEPTGPDPAIQALSEIMSQQMQSILQSKTVAQVSQVQITSPNFLEQQAQAAQQQQQGFAFPGQAPSSQGASAAPIAPPQPIIPAGEIIYAQLITEANSDVPGPVLAQIAGGPLNGTRLLGQFEVQQELLTLTFDSAVIDDQITPINAIALDPGTTLPGLATEVDRRYLKRIILPAAAAFIEGAAGAVSEAGLTTITVDGGAAVESEDETDSEQEFAAGLEEAAAELTDILDEMADDAEVLVKIHAGTPMGILLLDGIFKPGENPAALSQQQNTSGNNGNLNFDANNIFGNTGGGSAFDGVTLNFP